MLSLSLVQEIERLVAEGQLSQRKIAARLGVSRGTVNSVATGRRGVWGRETRDDHDPLRTGPAERCPHCGYRVTMPCLVCDARQYQSRKQKMKKLAPAATASPKPTLPMRSAHAFPTKRVA